MQKTGKDGITAGPIGTKLCAHNYADGSVNGHRLHFNPIFGGLAL